MKYVPYPDHVSNWAEVEASAKWMEQWEVKRHTHSICYVTTGGEWTPIVKLPELLTPFVEILLWRCQALSLLLEHHRMSAPPGRKQEKDVDQPHFLRPYSFFRTVMAAFLYSVEVFRLLIPPGSEQRTDCEPLGADSTRMFERYVLVEAAIGHHEPVFVSAYRSKAAEMQHYVDVDQGRLEDYSMCLIPSMFQHLLKPPFQKC